MPSSDRPADPEPDPALPERDPTPPDAAPDAEAPGAALQDDSGRGTADPEPHEPPGAEDEGADADGPDDELDIGHDPLADPSLRAHLAESWRTLPTGGRLLLLGILLGIVAWKAIPAVVEALQGPTEEEVLAQATLDRAQWAAMRRQSPDDLGPVSIEDALGPGDAERADDRYADYYVHEADSVAFSILVTSDDFAPDLAVRRPDGVTVAASSLLRTASRAEIDGLRGPGRFEVVVTSLRPRSTGAYELAVLPAEPIDSLYVDDEAVLDTLGAGPVRAGRYEHAYGIATGSELPVVIRVVSDAFTPRVHLLGPNGEVTGATQQVPGDTLRGVVLRYLPGWDAPYRLLVTSEEPRARGAYAVDVVSVPIRDLVPNARGQRAILGDLSMADGGRLIDTYKFRLREESKVTLTVQSEAFAPAFRLWRIERRRRDEVAEQANERTEASVGYTGTLDAGEYYLDVTTGGEEPTMAGGDYGLTVRAESTEPDPPPQRPSGGGDGDTSRPVPDSRFFGTEVRRRGESGGSSFEVGVTGVALSYPGGQRTRVQMSVTVRSIDYTGNWAPWDSFARQAYVVDDGGRRYTAAVGESRSPSGAAATPGTARRGIVVFYHQGVVRDIDRLVLVASIGDRTLSLPVPVP